MRRLQHEQVADSTGRVLVVVRTPNWEDYVHLACREIRLHAAEHIQIARRLRAMLENLAQTLPERRRPALRLEIDLLDRSIQNTYLFAEDMALARIPDAQGMGGASTAAPVVQGLRGQVADAWAFRRGAGVSVYRHWRRTGPRGAGRRRYMRPIVMSQAPTVARAQNGYRGAGAKKYERGAAQRHM